MEKWLILSYFAGLDGNPASHHIDDRLEKLRKNGIDVTLLSGFFGKKNNIKHIRLFNVSPAGLQHEVKKIKNNHGNVFLKIFYSLLKIIVFPFKIIEKFVFNGDIHYSWSIPAALYGTYLVLKNRPAVIYTTGGDANAHIAGLLIHKVTGVALVAEFQDPLYYFDNLNFIANNVEKMLAQHAKLLIYLTKNAAMSAKKRLNVNNIEFIYSGSNHEMIEHNKKADKIRFAHIGQLYGSRNMNVFFKAIYEILQENKQYHNNLEIVLVGGKGKNIIKQIKSFQYQDLISNYETVSRKKAQEIMHEADVLLLIQHMGDISTETIPSKVFDYMQSGKLIFGLTYNNDELNNILIHHGHYGIDMNNLEMVKKAIIEILENKKIYNIKKSAFTVERSVQELISKVKEKITN